MVSISSRVETVYLEEPQSLLIHLDPNGGVERHENVAWPPAASHKHSAETGFQLTTETDLKLAQGCYMLHKSVKQIKRPVWQAAAQVKGHAKMLGQMLA